jgi:hypothetical protein
VARPLAATSPLPSSLSASASALSLAQLNVAGAGDAHVQVAGLQVVGHGLARAAERQRAQRRHVDRHHDAVACRVAGAPPGADLQGGHAVALGDRGLDERKDVVVGAHLDRLLRRLTDDEPHRVLHVDGLERRHAA